MTPGPHPPCHGVSRATGVQGDFANPVPRSRRSIGGVDGAGAQVAFAGQVAEQTAEKPAGCQSANSLIPG